MTSRGEQNWGCIKRWYCQRYSMGLRHARWTKEMIKQCLRKILRIRWHDHVSTKELLERAGMKPLSVEVMSRKWKMIGHILRKDHRNDCIVAMSWAPEGKRRRGRPKTTWRRTVEKEKQEAGWKSWEEVRTAATNREEWKSSVKALGANRHK